MPICLVQARPTIRKISSNKNPTHLFPVPGNGRFVPAWPTLSCIGNALFSPRSALPETLPHLRGMRVLPCCSTRPRQQPAWHKNRTYVLPLSLGLSLVLFHRYRPPQFSASFGYDSGLATFSILSM